MRRSVTMRVLLAFWGLWFAGTFLELPGFHACPVHAGAVPSSEAPAAVTHDHGHAASHESQPQSSHHGDSCTCLAHCCGLSPVAVAEFGGIATEQVLLRSAVVVTTDAPAPLVRRAYDRPFANGPPVA